MTEDAQAAAVAARHASVMLRRCTDVLSPALQHPGAVTVDATLGMGGHAAELLRLHPHLRLVGIDRDPLALELAGRRLEGFGDRVTLVHAVHDELPAVLDDLGLAVVDAVFFDLGVSSFQLDEVERGFSYARDAPLDMRMDPGAPTTAADVLNTYPQGELARVLRVYGEERFAGRIAAAVVRQRASEPFLGSARLVDLVRENVPAATRRTGGNPAKRTFQALRIEVNDELRVVERALPAAFERLAPDGRLAVLTFHSLEDRIAKNALRRFTESSAPPDLPFLPPGSGPRAEPLTRGGEAPDEEELAANPRAASARLRAVRRLPGEDSGQRGRAVPGRPARRHGQDSRGGAAGGPRDRGRRGSPPGTRHGTDDGRTR
ncbi:16S rRNA (cytosine(1402)-N(4))-methyltransferase RsmH [Paenibacillus sp. TRM 82003]|uniref:16S rRNA (cytosine(1402)-N(4))-methyltransferase RsmH n=1 Tax=Kineococcus sp. TRM81007 TaxID=2925831 RepID=UPI001F56E814|nr:16S rRNA (cytosine(1402)-N(4))-methyltransferase RsmH [Kineococcus sp. TRM81007]MCI2239697.1 16S rRNA (cytosine(1402)-N(4))-methyltransferase RsmH [Kineococcus sp. TRM81007]MCI3926740.1 16S rRNA (cytosine(1402)-N(4))-methyltransferase RsmH [Paenibacillus sp. TRM 82003]